MLSRRVVLRCCSVSGLFERGQTPSAALLLQGPPDDLPRITAHQKPFEGDGGGEEEVSSSRPSTPRRLRLKGDGQPGGARLSSCPPAAALALHTPAPGAALMGGKNSDTFRRAPLRVWGSPCGRRQYRIHGLFVCREYCGDSSVVPV